MRVKKPVRFKKGMICLLCLREITRERFATVRYYEGQTRKPLRCLDCIGVELQKSRHRKRDSIQPDDPRDEMPFPHAEWGAKLDACKGICPKCGQKANLTMDHIKPFSLGGDLHIDNVQPLCKPCNTRKKNKWTENVTAKAAA